MGPAAVVVRLAWRNLWRNLRRTTIMLAAVVVGVWAMIFMIALMRGMVDDMLLTGIRSLPGHVQIHHPRFRDDPTVNNLLPRPGAALLAALDQPDVVAWSSRVRVPAVIMSERNSRGVTLVGIDPGARIGPVVRRGVHGRGPVPHRSRGRGPDSRQGGSLTGWRQASASASW